MTDCQTSDREPVVIVEIQQPYCSLTHGVGACTATETGDDKCFNTRFTCNDSANFDLSSLSLYFTRGTYAEQYTEGVPYAIPSLLSVTTSPTRVNLAGTDRSASGLGNRALCTITLQDHPHTDRRVDPYLSDRTYDPMERASFWTKWLARNPYRNNAVVKVYECYEGVALSSMHVRTFILQEVSGPTPDGKVTLKCKDVLTQLEERKSQAPLASPGVLYEDIDASATSIKVANAVAADYGATGTIRVDEELMTYSAISTNGGYITFTITARGSDGTTAASHDLDEPVQECLRYTSERVDDILEDLLNVYGGIPSAYLDTTAWATEVDNHLAAILMTTIVSTPTAVTELVSSLQVEAMCYIWWDEVAGKVKLQAIRGRTTDPDLLTDERHIVAGSFSLTERPAERVSQLWLYYSPKLWTDSLTDENNWKYLYVSADLQSETDELYGEPSIRKIFARWVPTSSIALSTGSKLVGRYASVPRRCKFRMDAKDRSYWVGDIVRISHFLDVDAAGEKQINTWTILSAEEVIPGTTVEYEAEDTTLYGNIVVIQAAGAGDYVSGTSDLFDGWIGDAAGKLSDGEDCARAT